MFGVNVENFRNDLPMKKLVKHEKEKEFEREESFLIDKIGVGKIDIFRMVRENISKNLIIQKVVVKNFFAYKMLLEIKKKDRITFDHVLGVTENVLTLLEANGESVDSDLTEKMVLASLVHDAGKTDNKIIEVIKKSEKLKKKDRSEMQKHSRKIFDWLKNINMLDIGKIVVQHHELGEDGFGEDLPYPRSGDDSNYDGPERRQDRESFREEAKILAIADVFDALTKERQYKKAMPIKKCEKIMRNKFRGIEDGKNISVLVEKYKNRELNQIESNKLKQK